MCDEGYQSSLAASTLQQLGFARATDLVGGFQAWRAAGLPVAPELEVTTGTWSHRSAYTAVDALLRSGTPVAARCAYIVVIPPPCRIRTTLP